MAEKRARHRCAAWAFDPIHRITVLDILDTVEQDGKLWQTTIFVVGKSWSGANRDESIGIAAARNLAK